jgi:hypothetical protein
VTISRKASSCFVLLALAIETLFSWKCLLSTDLSTLNILAASEILGLLALFRNAIASSIGAMVAKISRVEEVLFVAVEVCPTPGKLLTCIGPKRKAGQSGVMLRQIEHHFTPTPSTSMLLSHSLLYFT